MLTAANRDAVLKEWLARTLQTYPALSSRFLGGEKDRFRNPVGHELRKGLPVLLDELLGAMDDRKIVAALDGIVRMRAVQDFAPSEALAFLFLPRGILRETAPEGDWTAVHERIDRMALLAFDLFVKCREKTYEIKANEARRSVYLLERLNAARTPGGDGGSLDPGDAP